MNRDTILQDKVHLPLFISGLRGLMMWLKWWKLSWSETNAYMQDNCMSATELHKITFIYFKSIKMSSLNKTRFCTEFPLKLVWQIGMSSSQSILWQTQGTYHGTCKVLVQCLQQYSPSTSQCLLPFVSELWWNQRGERKVINVFSCPWTLTQKIRPPHPMLYLSRLFPSSSFRSLCKVPKQLWSSEPRQSFRRKGKKVAKYHFHFSSPEHSRQK